MSRRVSQVAPSERGVVNTKTLLVVFRKKSTDNPGAQEEFVQIDVLKIEVPYMY